MITAVFNENDNVGDFLKNEYDERYTRVSGTIKNIVGNTIAANSMVPGQPLNLNAGQWELVAAGTESGIDGFLVDRRGHEELANNAITAEEYSILERGPALVNPDAMPTNDLATVPAAFNVATLITRMAALGIKTLREPATVQDGDENA